MQEVSARWSTQWFPLDFPINGSPVSSLQWDVPTSHNRGFPAGGCQPGGTWNVDWLGAVVGLMAEATLAGCKYHHLLDLLVSATKPTSIVAWPTITNYWLKVTSDAVCPAHCWLPCTLLALSFVHTWLKGWYSWHVMTQNPAFSGDRW